MRPLKIASIQMSLKEGDVKGNSEKAWSLLEDAGRSGAGLAVLPEMWWTGFSYRKLATHAPETPRSLDEAGRIAARYGMTVIGGWPEEEKGNLYNAAYVIGPDGTVLGSYRKVHLFAPMKEEVFLSRGDKPFTVDTTFGKVGVVLCYDLRFPEFVRSLALAGAEIVVAPSQWPEARVDHYRILLQARAIENQIFVVGSNRTGRGGKVVFGGASAIVGPRGEVLARCGREEGAALADVDLNAVSEVRGEICYLDDRIAGVDDLSS